MSIVKPTGSWRRTVLLSIGLFFPAFIFSIPITMVWQQLRWPYDWQFRHAAVAVSFCVGITATIISLIWGCRNVRGTGASPLLLMLLLRAFSGILGLSTACVTLVIPLLFCRKYASRTESAKQYGGHASLPGTVGGIALVLLISGLFGVGAYILLRLSVRGRTATAVRHLPRN